jgi:hypothetical protein
VYLDQLRLTEGVCTADRNDGRRSLRREGREHDRCTLGLRESCDCRDLLPYCFGGFFVWGSGVRG